MLGLSKVLPVRTILAPVIHHDNSLSATTSTVAVALPSVVSPPSFHRSLVLAKRTVARASLLVVLPPSVLRCSKLGCMCAALSPATLFVHRALCFPLVTLVQTWKSLLDFRLPKRHSTNISICPKLEFYSTSRIYSPPNR